MSHALTLGEGMTCYWHSLTSEHLHLVSGKALYFSVWTRR